MTFTLVGEGLILVMWGLVLFPEGALGPNLVWTATGGVAMGGVIGALVNVLVIGRWVGRPAAIASALMYVAVLSYCALLCYRIDVTMGLFGARTHPGLFLNAGLLAALVTSVPYAWLLCSARGQRLLTTWGY
jgi:hypothetical protein